MTESTNYKLKLPSSAAGVDDEADIDVISENFSKIDDLLKFATDKSDASAHYDPNSSKAQSGTAVAEAIVSHNENQTAHEDIRTSITEAKTIAMGKANSLVFDTKEQLDSWVGINENLYYTKTISDTFNYSDYESFGGNVPAVGGTTVVLPKGTYTIGVSDNNLSLMTLSEYLVAGTTSTYQITVDEATASFAWTGTIPENETVTWTAAIQIDKGTTIGYPMNAYTREDGITKSDLKAGDLLLVEETGVPDGYWDGSAFVEMEAQSAQKADQTYSPTSENAQSGKAVAEAVETEQKRADSTLSNALKGNKSGSAILIDDVSPVTHEMGVKVSSDTVTDLTAVKVIKCGKNLFNKDMEFNASNRVSSEEGANFQYTYFIQLQPKTTYYCTVFNLYPDVRLTLLSSRPNVNAGVHLAVALFGSDGSVWKTQLALTTGDTGKLYIGTFIEPDKTDNVNYTLSEWVQKCNLQIELGNTGTEYEPYITPTEYTPNADGTVDGITSLYPNTTLMTDTDGVLIDCEYNRDVNKAFAELQQAIISLGGNV